MQTDLFETNQSPTVKGLTHEELHKLCVWPIEGASDRSVTLQQKKDILKITDSFTKFGIDSFWRKPERHELPLNVASTDGNRLTNSRTIRKSLEEGFSWALHQNPVAVAIDADYLLDALEMEEYKWLKSKFVDCGWVELNGKMWYVLTIDGEHRRIAEMGMQGVDPTELPTLDDIPTSYTWEVEVLFANVKSPHDAITAYKLACDLMTLKGARKIRKWSGTDVFVADIESGLNPEAMKTAAHMYYSGVCVKGRQGIGRKGGFEVLEPQFQYSLKDPLLNDDMRFAGVTLLKDIMRESGFVMKTEVQVPTTLLHSLALIMAGSELMREGQNATKGKRGYTLYNDFVEWFVSFIPKVHRGKLEGIKAAYAKLKSDGAEIQGVNAHHNEQIACYAGIVHIYKKEHGRTDWCRDDMRDFVGLPKIKSEDDYE